jgi:hypothetical protein
VLYICKSESWWFCYGCTFTNDPQKEIIKKYKKKGGVLAFR